MNKNELNHLMAEHEKVMGWEDRTVSSRFWVDGKKWVMAYEDWNPTSPDGIAQAMQCVKKFLKDAKHHLQIYCEEEGYEVFIQQRNGGSTEVCQTSDKSAPLAICQALAEALEQK